MTMSSLRLAIVGFVLCVGGTLSVRAEEKPAADTKPTDPSAGTDVKLPTDPPGLRRLSPTGQVWIDAANKRIVMVGSVVQREGQMEMFACLKNTKEHESILAVPTEAYVVHAGLVAIGAEPGNPVKFLPKYVPASGTQIDVWLYWTDAKGVRQHCKAQEWLRNLHTGKAMDVPWVFAGSSFWEDANGGKRHYQAEEGDFICVSNFASAMLDLPIESSQSNAALLFEPITDRIPPKGTNVTIALVPQLKGQPAERGADPKVDLLVPAAKDASAR